MLLKVFKQKRVRWVGHAAGTGQMRSACKVLVAKHLIGSDHLGKPRLRCEDNIKYILEKPEVMVVSGLKWLGDGLTVRH
jgi:hypothetical protein